MISRYGLVLGALAILATTPATAATVALNNASFEQSPLIDGAFRAGFVNGWNAGGNVGWQNPTTQLFSSVPDGQQTAWLGGWKGVYGAGSLSQAFKSDITGATQFTINVDVGKRADLGLAPFVIELLSGDQVVASGGFTDADLTPGQFRNFSLSYDATSGSAPLTLRFRVTQETQTYTQVNFDNVRIEANALQTAAVPEPASWALMILGFGGAGAALRRRRGALVV